MGCMDAVCSMYGIMAPKPLSRQGMMAAVGEKLGGNIFFGGEETQNAEVAFLRAASVSI